MQETQVQSLGQEDLLEKEMAIQGASTPGGESTPVFLPGKSHWQRSMAGYCPQRSQKVRHDWSNLASWCAGLKNMHFWALLLSDGPSSVLCSDFCIFTHLALVNEIRINYSYLWNGTGWVPECSTHGLASSPDKEEATSETWPSLSSSLQNSVQKQSLVALRTQ